MSTSKKGGTDEVVINREVIKAMKWAGRYSSRGAGFLLASIGVFLVQGFHMFLAFSIVTPFEGGWNFLVSAFGAVFLSGALLYFVSRSSDDNPAAVKAVTMFTALEIVLGLIFYADKLIYKPLMDGVAGSALQYPAIAMGVMLAIFIPVAIKTYASQVRALEPIDGEKHDLSKADRLQISEDINKMIDERLKEYSLDYKTIYEEMDTIRNSMRTEFNNMYATIYDSITINKDILESEIRDLKEMVQDLMEKTTETEFTVIESTNTVEEIYKMVEERELVVNDYSIISDKILTDLGLIFSENEMLLDKTMNVLATEKIKEMSDIFREQGAAQKQLLHTHTKRLSKQLDEHAQLMTTIVQETAIAKATGSLELYVDDWVSRLVDKEGIIKTVIHKLQTEDLDNHEIQAMKRAISAIKDKVRTFDDNMTLLEQKVVKKGDKNIATFHTKKGEKTEDRPFYMTIDTRSTKNTEIENNTIVDM
jgi:hypothetical protein